jgi:hypothetical protein
MVRRTPTGSLEEIFCSAAAQLVDEEEQSATVAEALGYLQQGFDAHYAKNGAGATDDDILVGDNAYAWAVETIARLDEPRFVAVASRMIRDGAGEISARKDVRLDLWVPHLADLLQIISGEDTETSQRRIRQAMEQLQISEEAP